MKLKKRDPHSPEVINEVLDRIRQMTPEEALAFLHYRTPGIEETDMTGMLSDLQKPNLQITIDLTPEEEARLHAIAVRDGQDNVTAATSLLRHALRQENPAGL